LKTIIYTGYTYSGGIIAGLILREINSVVVPANLEFRLLKERFGLLDLEDALFHNSDPEIIDLAIKDFLWLSRNFARPAGRFKKVGFGYNQLSNGSFFNETLKYIKSITGHKYYMSWHFYDFKKSLIETVFWRLIRKITKNFRYGREEAYFAYPNYEDFTKATRNYIEIIINDILKKAKIMESEVIALPKAVNPFRYSQVVKTINYFNNCKIIIVDRNPKDVFLELVRSGKERYLINSKDPVKVANSFITFYKSLRSEQIQIGNHENVLIVKFEDLCLNYDDSLNIIYDFLGVGSDQHIKKGYFFKPEESKKNIRLWQTETLDEKSESVLKIIEEQLGENI
jgi:hypothetical protein